MWQKSNWRKKSKTHCDNTKTQIVTKLKNSKGDNAQNLNCEKTQKATTQKLKLWPNSKKIATTQKLKLWQTLKKTLIVKKKSKPQIVITQNLKCDKIKNSNCDKT